MTTKSIMATSGQLLSVADDKADDGYIVPHHDGGRLRPSRPGESGNPTGRGGDISLTPPPSGGWPLPQNLNEILQIFRDVLGTRWHEPAPETVRNLLADIEHLLRIARTGIDAFLFDDSSRETLNAMRTLLSTLPDFIANAENAAEEGRRRALPSQGDWLAWRGKELLAVLEPWKHTLATPRRADRRRRWHWIARTLASMDVLAIIKRGTAARRVSFAKPTAPAVEIIRRLLASAGLHRDGAAIVEVLRDRKGR